MSYVAGYKLRVNGGTYDNEVIDVGPVTEYLLTPTEADTEYTVEVSSYDDSDNQSAWSAPVVFTTPLVSLLWDNYEDVGWVLNPDYSLEAVNNDGHEYTVELTIDYTEIGDWIQFSAFFPDSTFRINLADGFGNTLVTLPTGQISGNGGVNIDFFDPYGNGDIVRIEKISATEFSYSVNGEAPETITQTFTGDVVVTILAYTFAGTILYHPVTSESADIEAPSAPTSPAAVTVSASQIDLSWDAATDNVGVTAYSIRRALDSGFTSEVEDFNIGNVLVYSDDSLLPDTTYYYKIRARDGSGNWGDYSTTVSDTTDVLTGALPSDISSLVHWYDVETIVDGVDGNPYGVWEDVQGSADLSSLGTNRPLYIDGVGSPYLEFDGSDDFLQVTHSSLNDFAYFAVLEIVSNPIDYTRIFEHTTGNGVQVFTVGTTLYFYINGSGLTGTIPSTPTLFIAIYCERSGSTGKLRIEGVETTGAMDASATGGAFSLGAGTNEADNSNIRIMEFCEFNNNLSGGDFAILASYVLDKYGLSV